MKGKRLFYNTVVLTSFSLVLRSFALYFQIYLSKRMGAAGIGLFQLVMSVNMFAATLAISGIRFAATRLVSEEMGKGGRGSISPVVRRCTAYAAVTGTATMLILIVLSGFIGTTIIGDGRTVLPLRILGLSFPFLAMGAAFHGYFTGVCRIGSSTAASVSEQIIKVAVSMLLLSVVPKGNVELMCAAVVSGNVAGEVLSFFIIWVLYRLDVRKNVRGQSYDTSKKSLTPRIINIAVPLAIAAYARTAISTLQNVLVPKGLKKSGVAYETALAGYGTIQGMVFPIITFPAVLFSSLSELVVPELTEEQVRGRNDRITKTANFLLKMCLLFSAGAMGALYCFAPDLGFLIYESSDIGGYIRILSFLMPLMYMDHITDGMLRGVGQHLYSMRLNVVDSFLSTALIYLLLPKMALKGYILILYLSEIFNFSLSIRRLSKVTKIKASLVDVLKTAIAVCGAVNFTRLLIRELDIGVSVLSLIGGVISYIAIYSLLLFVLSTFRKNELKNMVAAIK